MTNRENSRKPRRGGARLAKAEPRTARRAGRPNQKKRPGKTDGRRRILIVAGLILAVLLCVFLAYRNWAKAPKLPSGSNGNASDNTDDDMSRLDGTQPYLTGDRKENFYTFLVIGRDTGGGGNTDTLMLASYDVANQQAALMSIPRDTMVNVSWDVKKINSVYNMNKHKGDDAAIDALEDAVAGLVGFRPDYTVVMEWEAVGEIVDAIGGVWFEIPFNMYYRDMYQDLFINQPKGYRLLSGSDAMEVVRWRKNNSGVSTGSSETDGSDLSRTKVQQDFIAAVLKQCLQIKNVARINQIATAFTENVSTELSMGNLVWFAEQALLGGFSAENMFSCTMPNTTGSAYSRSYHNYQSYVTPNADELIGVVNQYFNPYQQDVTLSNLDLMSINSDGSVSSSTGRVKDSTAAQPVSVQKPADTPVSTEPVDNDQPGPDPTDDPADTPGQDPGNVPADDPVDTPTQSPEVTPAPEPGDQPSDVPAQDPEPTPSDQPPAESVPVDPAPAESNTDEIFTLPEGVT